MVLARRIVAAAVAAMLVAGASPAATAKARPAAARIAAPDPDLTIEERSELLKAGQFVWAGDALTPVSSGQVSIVVSLPLQRMHVYRGAELIAASTVSTGMEGRETPVGEYPILQKKVMHRSNLYDDAPMPFMQRLTWDGIALHAGRNPGYPASHGCVRLPKAFAEKLYGATSLGAVVYVTDVADLTIPAAGTLPYYEPDMAPFTNSDEVTMIQTTAAR